MGVSPHGLASVIDSQSVNRPKDTQGFVLLP